jgi:hypothetical protein
MPLHCADNLTLENAGKEHKTKLFGALQPLLGLNATFLPLELDPITKALPHSVRQPPNDFLRSKHAEQTDRSDFRLPGNRFSHSAGSFATANWENYARWLTEILGEAWVL